MNQRIFDIDFAKLAKWLTPRPWRGAFNLAWLAACLAPVSKMYQDHRRFRMAMLYRLEITPQVCKLEKMLNDQFDVADRRIFISDPIDQSAWFAFLELELKPVAIFLEAENSPKYTYTDFESIQVPVDFLINVPSSITFDRKQMTALVDSYKLAGKRYQIITF